LPLARNSRFVCESAAPLATPAFSLVKNDSTKMLVVSHHLTKLAIRSNLERLTPEQFLRVDRDEKPINCGVTVYRGDAAKNELVLSEYSPKLY